MPMKNPCKDSNLISKGIEWVSLISGIGLYIIIEPDDNNGSEILMHIAMYLLVIKNILFYLNERFLKFPEKIELGVSEKAELWCQKNLKLSSKDYVSYLKTSQKRREISFLLSLSVVTIWWISAVIHNQYFSFELFYILPGILVRGFVVGYPIGFLYGAWKYRNVEKPDEGNGTNNDDYASYYGLTGDMGEAIVLASANSRR
jgi:hypothetical protein